MRGPQMSDEDLTVAWETVLRGVLRTHQQVLERIDLEGRPLVWFAVLHLLFTSVEHRLPMTHLARELSITTGGFTKLADRMARDGLIDRRNSSQDRRVVYATLTAAGLRLARRTETQYKEALREVLGDLPLAGLAALREGAKALRDVHAAALPVPQPPAPVTPRHRGPERRKTR